MQIVLGFLARRYFIYYFSTEYLGLNSLFSNVINILSLAELGFGGALVFAMYRPMAEGDEEKVRQLLSYYRKCYLIIGVVILTAGLCVLPFMDYFKSKAPNVNVNIYIVYLLILFNTIISYFFAHRRSVLYASQRSDIESKIAIITKVLLNLAQLLIILLTKNFYLYVGISGLFTLLDNVIVFFVTQKRFKEFIGKPKYTLGVEERQSIRKNVFSLFFHKLGGVIVFGTDSLLIFTLFNAETLGIYSNYMLITSQITTFIGLFIGAIQGSVGNSIASESVEHNKKLFEKLNFAYFAIISFCTACIFALVDPFISVVLVKGDASLLIDTSVKVLILVSFYLTQSRRMVVAFKDCNGLFYQNRFSPVVESIINLVASVVLAQFIGLAGIILGTIISTIFVPLWVEPYILNKYYFKESTPKYFAKYTLYTICMIICCILTYLVGLLVPQSTVWWLVAKFALCGITAVATILLTMSPFKEFKECIHWSKNIFHNVFQKIKKQ